VKTLLLKQLGKVQLKAAFWRIKVLHIDLQNRAMEKWKGTK
jgi:hypothetical protein